MLHFIWQPRCNFLVKTQMLHQESEEESEQISLTVT